MRSSALHAGGQDVRHHVEASVDEENWIGCPFTTAGVILLGCEARIIPHDRFLQYETCCHSTGSPVLSGHGFHMVSVSDRVCFLKRCAARDACRSFRSPFRWEAAVLHRRLVAFQDPQPATSTLVIATLNSTFRRLALQLSLFC